MYKHNEISWLSVLQGFAMLLVVVGHVFQGKSFYHWENILQTAIYNFHMPLFMFISGFLLSYTALNKKKTFLNVLKNKAVRLLIPYFVLNLITILLKVTFANYMLRGAEISIRQVADAFIWLTNMPLGEMWFINTLFALFLLYPLYQFAERHISFELLLLSGFCVLHFTKPFLPSFIFDFPHIFSMGIFFYSGVLISKYKFANHFNSVILLIATIVLFIIFSFLILPSSLVNFGIKIFGIAASFAFALNIAKYLPNLFISFRKYTYQIFLIGIFVQIAVRIIVLKIHVNPIIHTFILYSASIILGTYIPVLLSKIINKSNFAVLKLPLGL